VPTNQSELKKPTTFLHKLGAIFSFFVAILINIWAAAALLFDFPSPAYRIPLAVTYTVAILAALITLKSPRSLMVMFVAFAIAATWWFSLKPSNDRDWQRDVAQTAWAETNGDQVVIHNVRNFEYRTETDYTPHWETRTVNLSKLRGVDLSVIYWGSPYIAHTILSFDFADQGYLAISVETRKEVGESYSAIRGFFRYYELIYTIADERDVLRLRTNYRPGVHGEGEDVYLFHTLATPQQAQAIFLDYLRRVNHLRDHPEWYNALTNNCTTNVALHVADAGDSNFSRWDWRILLNGKSDEMLYDHGDLAGNLPFAELKRNAYINHAARAAGDSPDFSRLIRRGRPGF
jgi:Domain of unknown function (DUF4105)